jgi:hypothetical protein
MYLYSVKSSWELMFFVYITCRIEIKFYLLTYYLLVSDLQKSLIQMSSPHHSLLCVCEVCFSLVGLFLTKKDDIRDCWSDLGVSAGVFRIVDFRILGKTVRRRHRLQEKIWKSRQKNANSAVPFKSIHFSLMISFFYFSFL